MHDKNNKSKSLSKTKENEMKIEKNNLKDK